MPNLDGVGVIRMLPKDHTPRVVVVSISNQDSELAVEALQAGAVAIVQKPTALATEQLYEIQSQLVRAVKLAALARSPQRQSSVRPVPIRAAARPIACELVRSARPPAAPRR